MVDATMKSGTGAGRPGARTRYSSVASLLAVTAMAVVAGCTMPHRDSVTVGAIPDDYRTNHPIVISEKERAIEISVGSGDHGMTKSQRIALGGFLADYDRSAAPLVNIQVPAGSANEAAAIRAGREFGRYAQASGVSRNRIVVQTYAAGSYEDASPIRVSYVALQAHTGKCGRWPEDIVGDTSENKHYADFGCSYQNNLAAQVADPADLLGPRKQTTIDAEKRSLVIDNYRKAPIITGSEISY